MKRKPHHRKKHQRQDADSRRRVRTQNYTLERKSKKYGWTSAYAEEEREDSGERERE